MTSQAADETRTLLTVSWHIASALERHRKIVERGGGAVPDLLTVLEGIARFRVTSGQAGLLFDSPANPPDAAPVTPRLYTYGQTADALGLSESSVKRLVATGELTAVRIGGASRIRVADLDAYVADLRPTAARASA